MGHREHPCTRRVKRSTSEGWCEPEAASPVTWLDTGLGRMSVCTLCSLKVPGRKAPNPINHVTGFLRPAEPGSCLASLVGQVGMVWTVEGHCSLRLTSRHSEQEGKGRPCVLGLGIVVWHVPGLSWPCPLEPSSGCSWSSLATLGSS